MLKKFDSDDFNTYSEAWKVFIEEYESYIPPKYIALADRFMSRKLTGKDSTAVYNLAVDLDNDSYAEAAEWIYGIHRSYYEELDTDIMHG